MIRKFLYILIGVILIGCGKEYQPVNFTDLNVEMEQDQFQDTIYRVKNFNVTSTNDSVLTYAKARITDESGTVILLDEWRNIANSTFGLPERRIYNLNIEICREINGSEQSEFSTTYNLDNNDYPEYLKINTIEMDPNCLAPDGDYTISNSHLVLIQIWNDIEYGDLNTEEYNVDNEVLYLEKTYAPQTLTFTFTNLILPTRSYNKMLWKYYDIEVRYPQLYFGVEYQFRDIAFRLDVKGLLESGNNQPLTEYTSQSDDYSSTGGGAFFGTLKYEWIYE